MIPDCDSTPAFYVVRIVNANTNTGDPEPPPEAPDDERQCVFRGIQNLSRWLEHQVRCLRSPRLVRRFFVIRQPCWSRLRWRSVT